MKNTLALRGVFAYWMLVVAGLTLYLDWPFGRLPFRMTESEPQE